MGFKNKKTVCNLLKNKYICQSNFSIYIIWQLIYKKDKE